MKKVLTFAFAIMAMTACTTKTGTNPFLTEWDTPYGIPPFDKIQIDDYIPAIKAGIAQQQKEIDAITANPEAPTFENTIVPLELSGNILSKVAGVLYNISETDRSDALDSVVEAAIPLESEHSDNISFNKALYERIAAIYNGDQSALTAEQKMVLKNYYEDFVRNGVGLPSDKQDQLREINTAIASKTQTIGNNILAESNAFNEKFGITVSDYPNAMTTTEDRALRQQMFKAYTMRGHNGNDNDNRQLVLEVMNLRIRKAQIMGYSNPAAYILETKMAHDPETVDAFLDGIMKAAVSKANAEVADMQKIMDQDIAAGKLPAGTKIEPWDWWYYAEKVRKVKYDLDEDQIKPYFKLENVVNGIFLAAKQLYGVNMEKLEGVPSYNPEVVTTYKVTADDGSLLGIFTTDYLPRASKRGGAWMNNVRDQYVDADGNMVRPIIVNVGNLEEYLNIDEVQTVFHEFGHALHGLLTQCTYSSVSGTSVKRDFVETFSQINENWAFQPELLAKYAFHKDTGEVIPQELVNKIINALKFNQGFMTTELCAASILDMKWHELESIEGIDVDSFEKKVCAEMGLIDEIVPRYRTTYFNHIFSSGYSAGYYSYLWAEVLDKDMFAEFEKSGNVFNPELAAKFKATFLEKGGSEEPMELFRSFMGREPDNTAFLKGRGLL
ncbi:MAG: M3 family metallopeptidase [Bacteroidaceae bacterium]|nr:M3 family metallopeptidase [Bacteroidaceae bacterium]